MGFRALNSSDTATKRWECDCFVAFRNNLNSKSIIHSSSHVNRKQVNSRYCSIEKSKYSLNHPAEFSLS